MNKYKDNYSYGACNNVDDSADIQQNERLIKEVEEMYTEAFRGISRIVDRMIELDSTINNLANQKKGLQSALNEINTYINKK